MVVLETRHAIWLGGASNGSPIVGAADVFELRTDLTEWQERPDLRMPQTGSWISAITFDI